MQQLNLLDLPPIPDEPELEPVAVAHHPLSLTPSERHTLRWLEAKADYYLRLMNKFLDGSRCSQGVRSAELLRVYELRENILVAIYNLENRHLCERTQSMTTAAPVVTTKAAQTKTRFTELSIAVPDAS